VTHLVRNTLNGFHMMRYLFGPIDFTFADRNLRGQRQRGACLTFNVDGTGDLTINATDTWESVVKRFPHGWKPEFIAIYLPYAALAEFMWTVPVPIIGLAADWNLCWSWYRRCLRRCDLVLTDLPGVEVMAREGIGHAHSANLFGCERQMVEEGVGHNSA
jgi:hypothetical protein